MSKKNLAGTAILMLLLFSLSNLTTFAQRRVTVMTWNVHGGNPDPNDHNNCKVEKKGEEIAPLWRMFRFSEEILRYNTGHRGREIQVIAIQEIHRNQAYNLARRLREGPQHLPYHAHFFKTKSCRCGHPKLDYGNAIISSLKMSNRKEFDIPRQSKTSIAGCDLTEYTKLGATSVLVPGGLWVRIYTNHSAGDPTATGPGKQPANGPGNSSSPQEQFALKQLRAINNAIFQDDSSVGRMPRILMGDFNFDPLLSPTLYSTMKNLGYRDAWREAYPNGPLGNTVPTSKPPTKRFDYIFLGRGSGIQPVKNAEVLMGARTADNHPLSDHYPVVADLNF
jgi:endonuclease/exonuclease/phosphatase family metal-dependent hydrolase